MSQRRNITRREFLSLSAMAAAGAVVAGCAPATATPEAPTPTSTTAAPTAGYNEAPMLADLVASGALPPVDDRLPENPCVLTTHDGIGNYGGVMRRAFRGVSDRWGPTKLNDHWMVWWDIDLNVQPRLCESWEVNDDGTEWTFNFREGTKWSDGTPFTSESIVWWHANEQGNADLWPSQKPKWTSTVGGEKVYMDLDAPDDNTVVMTFAAPRTLFIYDLARGGGMESFGESCLTPAHYMKQYHVDFADDPAALEAAATDAGFETWAAYYHDRNWWYLNPDRPTLCPWLATNPASEELFIMERNPYYYGVDSEGNQLPYLDTIQHRLFAETQVLNLWVTSGEIDFQSRRLSIADYTLFKESEASGEYQTFVCKRASHVALQCNLTTKDERLREFFNNRDVRIAFSLAVDRDEMNELAYDGMYTPRQYSPMAESPQYYPKLTNAYLDYDVDEANRLLDAAGYDEKDSDGFRLWKDASGETLYFEIVADFQAGTPNEDSAQLLVQYLAEVGVKCAYKYIERSLYQERWAANDIEAAWWGGDRTLLPLAPRAPIFRGEKLDRPWCAAWGIYLLDPDDPNAEEPPAGHWIWDIWETWDALEAETDPDRQNELFFDILDIWAEELPMIGYLGDQPAPVIVKNGFRGYLDGMPSDDTVADEHFLGPETHYWENPEDHS